MCVFFSSEVDLDVEAVTFATSPDSPTTGFTSHLSPSASPGSMSAESGVTAVTDVTTTSGSRTTERLDSTIHTTAAQLWDSGISKEEGSTSLESEDFVTTENKEKPPKPTVAEDNLVFEANVTVDESKSSQKPTDSSSVLFRTSGYRVYWETATLAYEEASGQEPAAVTAILGEDGTPSKTLVDEIKVSPTVDVSFTPEREDKVSPTTEEDISGTPSLLDETMVSFSSEEVTASPATEKVTHAAQTPTNFATVLRDEMNTTQTLEEEAVLEKSTAFTTLKESSIERNVETEANVSSTSEEFKVDLTSEEEANVALTLEENSNFTSTVVFPPESQTSDWTLLTTTTESLNDLSTNGRKTPSATSTTVAAGSFLTTKPARITTITTTTHWSKRAWSPTTSAPRVYHKTSEPQKVTSLVSQTDPGVGDSKPSPTQPPTILIMPSERAAVGGAGKTSGNITATLITLTVLLCSSSQ